MASDCMPPIPARWRRDVGVQGALPVAVPQLVAVQLGAACRGQCAAVVVEQFAFAGLPVGGGHAGDQGVGQFAARVAAPHGLPVEQARLTVAEVDVSGMGVAVHDRVWRRVDESARPRGNCRR